MQFIIRNIKDDYAEVELYNGEKTIVGLPVLPPLAGKGDVIFIDIDVTRDVRNLKS